jgi:hypothetical protein
VDYIGDLAAFERDFAGHAAIARSLGPYKLSLHSGSDKFSIDEIAARLAAGPDGAPLVHLKTAGTSYLEALRTLAVATPALFREILGLARERYETDRATYHVSARLDRVTAAEDLTDHELASLIDQFDARQVLHVTFGAVLAAFGGRLRRRWRSTGGVRRPSRPSYGTWRRSSRALAGAQGLRLMTTEGRTSDEAGGRLSLLTSTAARWSLPAARVLGSAIAVRWSVAAPRSRARQEPGGVRAVSKRLDRGPGRACSSPATSSTATASRPPSAPSGPSSGQRPPS